MNAPDQIGAATIGYNSYSTITRLNRNKVFGRHTERQVYRRLDRQIKYTDDWTPRQTDKYTDD